MKTTITKIATVLMGMAAVVAMQAQSGVDLVPGINYSYNPANNDCHITAISVDVCNNNSDPASAFDVGMYLYDSGTGNYWVIDKYRLTSGLSGNACITISNWDINIDNSGQTIANGTYRLGSWVDASSEITETDENNNAGLLSGNNTYQSCANAVRYFDADKYVSLYPVPATNDLFMKLVTDREEIASVVICDIAGKQVQTISEEKMLAGNHLLKTDVSNLENGIYFVRITSGQKTFAKKFVVSR